VLHAKFLKEIVARHKKLKKGEQIIINASCIAIITKEIPSKLKNLGSFTIPIEIGELNLRKVLCDLGANINLMALSII